MTLVPPFVHEALAEAGNEPRQALEATALAAARSLTPARGMSEPRLDALLERLANEVAEVPTRYAPFFGTLAALLDRDEAAIATDLARAKSAKSFKLTPLSGVTILPLTGGPALGEAEVLLVRLAPGTRFPRHEHRGRERVLVLEGGYRDDEGRAFEAGDLDEHEGGTSHAFEALPDEPCVTVTVLERGIDFESWPLRGLMKLLGR